VIAKFWDRQKINGGMNEAFTKLRAFCLESRYHEIT